MLLTNNLEIILIRPCKLGCGFEVLLISFILFILQKLSHNGFHFQQTPAQRGGFLFIKNRKILVIDLELSAIFDPLLEVLSVDFVCLDIINSFFVRPQLFNVGLI